jgi:hypothetical protein
VLVAVQYCALWLISAALSAAFGVADRFEAKLNNVALVKSSEINFSNVSKIEQCWDKR